MDQEKLLLLVAPCWAYAAIYASRANLKPLVLEAPRAKEDTNDND